MPSSKCSPLGGNGLLPRQLTLAFPGKGGFDLYSWEPRREEEGTGGEGILNGTI